MPREKAKGKGKALKKTFVRSDEEVEVFLACALEYKTEKETEGVDWEMRVTSRRFKTNQDLGCKSSLCLLKRFSDSAMVTSI